MKTKSKQEIKEKKDKGEACNKTGVQNSWKDKERCYMRIWAIQEDSTG